jgi:hypothetical protein
VDAADTSRRGVVVTRTTWRDDWLHRGPELAFLDLWGYIQHVTRTEMPLGGEKQMADNEYKFAEHYILRSSIVQRYCPTEHSELMRIPKPRTPRVVRKELFAVLGQAEMKQVQGKWLGWNVCPRTITSPIK